MSYEELFEQCQYYKTEYQLLCSALRQKNKEITKLKKEISELKNQLNYLQNKEQEIEFLD